MLTATLTLPEKSPPTQQNVTHSHKLTYIFLITYQMLVELHNYASKNPPCDTQQ